MLCRRPIRLADRRAAARLPDGLALQIVDTLAMNIDLPSVGPPCRVRRRHANLVAFCTYLIIRVAMALRFATVAAVDHPRGRIPANVGVAASAMSRARARTHA